MSRPVKLYHYVFVLIDGTARFSTAPYRSKEMALDAGEKVKEKPPEHWPPVVGLLALPVWIETEREW